MVDKDDAAAELPLARAAKFLMAWRERECGTGWCPVEIGKPGARERERARERAL